MIKANELRHGNLIECQNGVSKILGIDKNKVKLIDNDWWYLTGIKPISLTEQWLIDFGFELIEMGTINYYSKGLIKDNDFDIEMYVYYHFRDGKIIECGIATNEGDTGYSMITELAYLLDISEVNKLQNIYFSLTGEELTLNNLHNK